MDRRTEMFIQDEIKAAFLDDLDAMWWAYMVNGLRHPTAKETIARCLGVIV